MEQMAAEGVEFVTNAHVGVNVRSTNLRRDFDAVVLAMGAEHPRDLNVPGRELKGIHFAMDFLPQQNQARRGRLEVRGSDSGHRQARGHHRRRRYGRGLPGHVAPAEGGVGASVRNSCRCLRRSARRRRRGRCGRCNCAWKARTKKAASANGPSRPRNSRATRWECEAASWRSRAPAEVRADRGREFTLDADLVLLAMGFTGPVKRGLDRTSWAWRWMRAATSRRRIIRRRCRACSRRATRGAGNRWWCGRSRKAARPPRRSISFYSRIETESRPEAAGIFLCLHHPPLLLVAAPGRSVSRGTGA